MTEKLKAIGDGISGSLSKGIIDINLSGDAIKKDGNLIYDEGESGWTTTQILPVLTVKKILEDPDNNRLIFVLESGERIDIDLCRLLENQLEKIIKKVIEKML